MTKKKDDLGSDDVQEIVDRAEDVGYMGTVPDPTPNESYTVAGVVKGKPTPETDAKAAADAHSALQQGVDGSNFKSGKK
jgi:hypothetical protein